MIGCLFDTGRCLIDAMQNCESLLAGDTITTKVVAVVFDAKPKLIAA